MFEVGSRQDWLKRENRDLDECQKYCDEDEECRFIYHLRNPEGVKYCIKYKSCDKLRVTTPTNEGMTYSKDWKCPNDKSELDESRH